SNEPGSALERVDDSAGGADYGGGAMQCPRCLVELPEGSRFCHDCGAELLPRCRECSHLNAVGSSFCVNCGGRLLAPAASEPTPPTPSGAAERRQVTVMFCGLVGPAFSS